MIKGVNRTIIEVAETGHPYFERALLFLTPDCAPDAGDALRAEANRLVKAAGTYSALRQNRRRSRRWRTFRGFMEVLAGAGIGWAAAMLLR